MKIEVARSKAIPAVRRDGSFVAQDTVFVIENLEGARLFRPPAGGIVAAGYEDRHSVVRADAHLMAIDADVDLPRLSYLGTRGGIGIDAVGAYPAWIAEGDEQVLGRNVGRHVDRTGRQRDRVAVQAQSARSRVDAERRHMVLAARRTRARARVARSDIEEPPRRVRPSIMHIGG
jgi:hypothetical protein